MKDYGNKSTQWREQTQHARSALLNWVKAGVLDEEIIERIFNGHYYWFVTFKAKSDHLKADPTGYVVLTDVSSKAEAQAEAKRLFDGYFDKVIPEWEFKMWNYSSREIGRYPEQETSEQRVTLDV